MRGLHRSYEEDEMNTDGAWLS